MPRNCDACGRPLKQRGLPGGQTVWVCKSPVCESYLQAPEGEASSLTSVVPEGWADFGRQLVVAFAAWCDQNGLSQEDGLVAAETLADELIEVAEGRA